MTALAELLKSNACDGTPRAAQYSTKRGSETVRFSRSPSVRTESIDVLVTNGGESPLHVWVEPWGREASIGKDEHLRMSFIGPMPAWIEIDSRPDRLMVFGWTGSTITDDSPARDA
jgi:hypothetical protein